jgi:hypothetical protein
VSCFTSSRINAPSEADLEGPKTYGLTRRSSGSRTERLGDQRSGMKTGASGFVKSHAHGLPMLLIGLVLATPDNSDLMITLFSPVCRASRS